MAASTPHRSDTNGIAERALRRVKEATSAVFLQSGLDEKWLSGSIEGFLVSMSVRDAPHQLIADLHGDLLREISAFTCVHWQGLGQAARALRKRNITDGAQAKKLILFDGAFNLSRHITVISANQFRMSIGNSIRNFGASSCPDEIQTNTATAPVDPSLAASRASTVSLSAPVSVTEHATRAPVDVYTAPARMIEHVAPAPVIEYIAPSPAVSCPSVQEIPEVLVVERIQEPIVETTENIAEIPVVQEQVIVQEILDVVVPLPPDEEFTEPVYNPVHQERIVAGENTHNMIGNSAVQEQVVVQELPPVVEQTQETIDVASSITEVPGPCATPVVPQIGDVGFDKHGKLCEVICINGRSLHIRGQIRVLYTWEKRGRYESGQWIPVSDFRAERDAKRRQL